MALLHQMLQICDILQSAAESSPPVELQPQTYFLARSGVLTLAYSGFPTSILRIQDALDQVDNLPPQTQGSRWPKTTLGALHDGTVLTRSEAKLIFDIASRYRSQLSEAAALAVDTVAVVEYEMRSLEKVDFVMAAEFSGPPNEQLLTLDAEHQKRVRSVLDQFDPAWFDLYMDEIRAPGHHVSHYCDTARGQTVIIDVDESTLGYVQAFQEEVDRSLPGYYYWFKPRCYHVTVRNISSV